MLLVRAARLYTKDVSVNVIANTFTVHECIQFLSMKLFRHEINYLPYIKAPIRINELQAISFGGTIIYVCLRLSSMILCTITCMHLYVII